MLRYITSLVAVTAAITLALTSEVASALGAQEGPREESTQDLITCSGLSSQEEQLACVDAIVESTNATFELPTDDAADSQLSQSRSSVLEAMEAPSVMESDNLYRHVSNIKDDYTVTPLEAKIVKVWVLHDGRFSVELDNGDIWRQTRRVTKVRAPEPGNSVEVYKKGPGDHRMRIEGNPRVAWVRRSDEKG